jgi:hypothetical protein
LCALLGVISALMNSTVGAVFFVLLGLGLAVHVVSAAKP